MVIRN